MANAVVARTPTDTEGSGDVEEHSRLSRVRTRRTNVLYDLRLATMVDRPLGCLQTEKERGQHHRLDFLASNDEYADRSRTSKEEDPLKSRVELPVCAADLVVL